MKTIVRWQKESILKALKTRRVLILSGPRQSGKTTLCRSLGSHDIEYRTLDDSDFLETARIDPGGFIKHQKSLLVIDEIQRVPQLLLAIKKQVDENNRPGQFLLTGSANIQATPTVIESLAGRVRHLRLRTLTQGEINGKIPTFLNHAFTENFSDNLQDLDKDAITSLAFTGGYPEAIALPPEDRAAWHIDYLDALIQRDLRDIANIRNPEAMKNLMRVLAAWSSKYIDASSIATVLQIARPSLLSYLGALEALYLVEKVPPFSLTDYNRVGKQSKFFATDTGFMAGLLGWNSEGIRFDSDKMGKLIESYVYTQLRAQMEAQDVAYNLYQYRDHDKREIDFIVQHPNGALLGIEVKAGSTITLTDFKHLRWFQANLAKNQSFIGILLHTGKRVVPYGPHLWGVPIAALCD